MVALKRELSQTVYRNVMLLCRVRGITQTELEERAGIAVGTISHWRAGRTGPQIVTLVKIAGVLGCTLDSLVKRKNFVPVLTPEERSEKSERERTRACEKGSQKP